MGGVSRPYECTFVLTASSRALPLSVIYLLPSLRIEFISKKHDTLAAPSPSCPRVAASSLLEACTHDLREHPCSREDEGFCDRLARAGGRRLPELQPKMSRSAATRPTLGGDTLRTRTRCQRTACWQACTCHQPLRESEPACRASVIGRRWQEQGRNQLWR